MENQLNFMKRGICYGQIFRNCLLKSNRRHQKGDKYIEFFNPFLEKLKATVSEELYNQFEEIFTTCVVENNKYYAVEGLQPAIGIMDGSYIPF